MFDFLTGFLLGIIFTIVAAGLGVYKLLLRLNDGTHNVQLQSTPSQSHIHFNPLKSVKHAIPKHSLDDNVFEIEFAHHNIETCAWLNTIAATLCVEALSSPLLVENLHKKLHEILNKPEDKPEMLGKIIVSDINMGTGLPLVDGIRVLSRAHDDSLHAEVGIRYDGGASFTISTELWMNWPTPKFAALPVSLHASFDHFEGTLNTSCHWRSATSTRLIIYLNSPPVFQLRIGSTIGHATKLVNVLQISSLLENMIYSFVNKELVFPNGFEVELEEGRVVGVRKLAQVKALLEKGEGLNHREAQRSMGDLSRRSFSVTS